VRSNHANEPIRPSRRQLLSSAAVVAAAGGALSLAGLDRAAPAAALGAVGDIYYLATDYGAVGDGSTDDTSALNAALAAAGTNGGVVLLDVRNGMYRITGPVNVPANVGLQGVGTANAAASTDPISTIKCDSGTAAVVFGDATALAGAYIRGPESGNFDVWGNSTGDPDGILRFDGVVDRSFRNVWAGNASGHVIRLVGQNCYFEKITAGFGGHAGTGHTILLTGGAGGHKFDRCSFASVDPNAATTSSHVCFEDTTGIPNAYTGGPSQNAFYECIFETQHDENGEGYGAYSILEIKKGQDNTFHSCLISANLTSEMASGYVVRLAASTSASFEDITLSGGITSLTPPAAAVAGAFYLGNLCYVNVSGRTTMSYVTSIFSTDGAPVLGCATRFVRGWLVGSLLNTLSGGSWYYATIETPSGLLMVNNADTGAPPIQVKREGETGNRFLLNPNGSMAWSSNGAGTYGQTLIWDAAKGRTKFTGPMGFDKQIVAGSLALPPSIHLNVAAPTLDATYTRHLVETTGGNVTAMTISNGTDGQFLHIGVYRSATQTIAWPTNVRWAQNTAPAAPTAGTFTFVTLAYVSSSNVWYECAGRVEDVPA
jgi:hypothetical protein